VKQFVRLRIGGSVQPELLVVDPNHRFVKHDLIRDAIPLEGEKIPVPFRVNKDTAQA
jgi:hypothetical protein